MGNDGAARLRPCMRELDGRQQEGDGLARPSSGLRNEVLPCNACTCSQHAYGNISTCLDPTLQRERQGLVLDSCHIAVAQHLSDGARRRR